MKVLDLREGAALMEKIVMEIETTMIGMSVEMNK